MDRKYKTCCSFSHQTFINLFPLISLIKDTNDLHLSKASGSFSVLILLEQHFKLWLPGHSLSWFSSYPTGCFFWNSFIWSFISFWQSNVRMPQSYIIEHLLYNLIQIHSFRCHISAGDFLVCISPPRSAFWLQTHISNYLLDILNWMSKNHLIPDMTKWNSWYYILQSPSKTASPIVSPLSVIATPSFQVFNPKNLIVFHISHPTCQQILLTLPLKYIQTLTTSHHICVSPGLLQLPSYWFLLNPLLSYSQYKSPNGPFKR